jgi:hypothetical protein
MASGCPEVCSPENEVEMASLLNSLGWKSTECRPNHNVYLGRRGQVIAVTVFFGRSDCKHYVLGALND